MGCYKQVNCEDPKLKIHGGGDEKSDVYGVGPDSREIKEHSRVAINYVHLNYKLQVEKNILSSTPNKYFKYFFNSWKFGYFFCSLTSFVY